MLTPLDLQIREPSLYTVNNCSFIPKRKYILFFNKIGGNIPRFIFPQGNSKYNVLLGGIMELFDSQNLSLDDKTDKKTQNKISAN